FSMLPDGMRNASTRSDRTTSQITSATAMDLTHSQLDCPTVRGGLGLSATLGLLRSALRLFPLGYEHVGLARCFPITVGSKNKFLAIRRKHGETVEIAVAGDLRETGAVQVHQIEVEVA